MKGVPQERYTKEFRQEAVKLVTEEKLSLPEVGRRLPSLLHASQHVYTMYHNIRVMVVPKNSG